MVDRLRFQVRCASHIYSNFVGTTPSSDDVPSSNAWFQKRCVLESSPYMSMCLYVRRGKSSIPSTFSDILDKSFLNEQTSLCFPKGKEKNLTEKKLFSLNFIVESTSLHMQWGQMFNLTSVADLQKFLGLCAVKSPKSRLTRIPKFIRRRWTTTLN